ncbi:dihydroneopterin aldolase [Pelotomaculum propionicicum]|uniref:7,8-dihydroneopterin aldolase n=1 Tax=Pelotomaculum propionicicum TaxID=258475 RepID=A0A4Y7RLT9_9FIRM|nr:dihydroneopterin aldolase [Pelotomaculum propionicicum]NLI11566.1 dihydroneopterin aldolase [Peptococcaceae bacterium]TEB09699.1 Dihydroneopterin aldolase [Pelotomaculum propionicicum]
MDKISLEGMEFYGYHGARPEEQSLGQRFIVDVELYLDLRRAGATDSLDFTVNYARVFELVRSIVCGPPRLLIESVAESVAGALLAQFPLEEVLVRVKKPQAPLPGSFTWAAVEIKRKKEQRI